MLGPVMMCMGAEEWMCRSFGIKGRGEEEDVIRLYSTVG
jgi:hypothetical protein